MTITVPSHKSSAMFWPVGNGADSAVQVPAALAGQAANIIRVAIIPMVARRQVCRMRDGSSRFLVAETIEGIAFIFLNELMLSIGDISNISWASVGVRQEAKYFLVLFAIGGLHPRNDKGSTRCHVLNDRCPLTAILIWLHRMPLITVVHATIQTLSESTSPPNRVGVGRQSLRVALPQLAPWSVGFFART